MTFSSNSGPAPSVRVIQDFPTPGIAFQDLAPLYGEPGLLGHLGADLAEAFGDGFDAVLGVEARGFVLGAAVAIAAGRPLVLARKEGKLPGPLHTAAYDLEYGSAVLTTQRDAFPAGARVLVIDDVLATGGTLTAAADLVLQAGATIAGFGVLLDLAALAGRKRLAPHPVVSLMTVT